MKAAVFEQFGEPAAVLRVRDVPAPAPGRGAVRVRMLASPINPSDLLVIRGSYGKLPTLPATPGFEGVGVVEENGGGFFGWRVLGKRVAVVTAGGGAWSEQVVIPARQAFGMRVPDDIPDEQAATCFVNPATALVMTRKVLRVPRGAWLLQTAAGSALGRMVIRLGRHYGFRTINVVRRRETAEELKALGADAVINAAEESIEDCVRALTDGRGVAYAIDAVGGATGSAAVRALGPGGRLLVYGTLSNEPLCFESRVLMVGGKRVEGFWLSEWARRQGPFTMLALFSKIVRLLRAGVLTTAVAETYPLDEIAAAVRRAEEPGRTGKVLLRLS